MRRFEKSPGTTTSGLSIIVSLGGVLGQRVFGFGVLGFGLGQFGVLLQEANECLHYYGVELFAGEAGQFGYGLVVARGFSVNAVFGHGSVGIHHTNYPRAYGNMGPG